MSPRISGLPLGMLALLVAAIASQPRGMLAAANLSISQVKPLPAPKLPDPPPADPAAGRGQTQPAAQTATGRAQTCPPNVGMVGPKMDLPPGGNELDTATLLVPCVYKGLSDTAVDRWTYYKLLVEPSQTLKIVFRLRDSNLPSTGSKLVAAGYDPLSGVAVRLHGPNGGRLDQKYANAPSGTQELEYKASEPGFAYIGLHHAVRDAALQFSIVQTKP